MEPNQQQYRTVDKFDRIVGSLEGDREATKTAPTTILSVSPILGQTDTYIIRTYLQREDGATILLQWISDTGTVRVPIPPKVAEAIYRQREALTAKVRKRIGKQQAAERKARGELPGFMKKKGK